MISRSPSQTRPRCGKIESTENSQQCCLARAARAKDRQELTRSNVEINVVETETFPYRSLTRSMRRLHRRSSLWQCSRRGDHAEATAAGRADAVDAESDQENSGHEHRDNAARDSRPHLALDVVEVSNSRVVAPVKRNSAPRARPMRSRKRRVRKLQR